MGMIVILIQLSYLFVEGYSRLVCNDVGYRYLLINSAKILKQTYYIDCYKDYIVTILKYTKINSMYFSIETIHDEIL